MGLFSRFEDKAESVIEGGASRGKGGIEPVKIAKRAVKEMQREKMVGIGHEYAPTLYNVLVSPEDDVKMSGYYPSLAGEIETYLTSKAKNSGLVFDCPPLVRFIVDDGLKRGRFDIIAENVSPVIIADLREEELEHYGIKEPEPVFDHLQPLPQHDPAKPAQPSGYSALEQATDDPFAPEPQDWFQEQSEQPAPVLYDAPDAEPEPDHQPQAAYDQPDAYESLASEPAVAPVAASAAVEAAAPAAERVYPPTEIPEQQSPQNDPAPSSASSDRTVFLGAPAQPAVPQALVYDFSTQVQHVTTGERTIIGRGTSCDIVISNPSVSRRHAELLHDESGWLVRDTGSTNGTFVNGARATQARLYNGDIITIGTTELEFREG